MTAAEYVLDVLGGASVFKGRAVPTSTELHQQIKRGLPYRSLESVRDRLGLSVLETSSVLHMPPRTLARAGRLASSILTNQTAISNRSRGGAGVRGAGHGGQGCHMAAPTESSPER
jgi:hypothetical protein